MAHLSAAAGAAVLRAACMGLEVTGDVTIKEREMGGGGGGFGGGGISTAVVDVVSPKARGGTRFFGRKFCYVWELVVEVKQD